MTSDRRKKELVEYIGTYENPDSVEIVNYIKLPYDMTLNALRELEEALRHVGLLFRLGCSNEESINDVIKTRVKPYLARDVEEYTSLILLDDAKESLTLVKKGDNDV